MRKRSAGPAGMTIIEVVMVLGIIAVILCMMIPAIISGRSAADRVSCMNNMKQIVLALHNYEVQSLALPPGVINPSGPIRNLAEDQHISWVVAVLSFMEQGGISGSINPYTSAYDPVNSVAANSWIMLPEAVPGRRRGRHQPAEGAGRAIPRRGVLPDGRHQPGDRAAVPGAAECEGLWRVVVDAAGCRGRKGLGKDYAVGG